MEPKYEVYSYLIVMIDTGLFLIVTSSEKFETPLELLVLSHTLRSSLQLHEEHP